MTEAPERIWATFGEDHISAQIEGEVYAQRYKDGMVGNPTSYIRADKSTYDAGYAQAVKDAAAAINEPIARIVYDSWYRNDFPVTSHSHQTVQDACQDAILALTPPTEGSKE